MFGKSMWRKRWNGSARPNLSGVIRLSRCATLEDKQWQKWAVLRRMIEFCRASPRLARGFATLSLLAALLLPFVAGILRVAAAETTTPGTAEEAGATAKTETYLSQLRAAVPWGWLEQEFRRQRSFPALARSRQLASKGLYDEAVEELESYL